MSILVFASIMKRQQMGTVIVNTVPYTITFHRATPSNDYQLKFKYRSSTSYLIDHIIINNSSTTEAQITVLGKDGTNLINQKIQWQLWY